MGDRWNIKRRGEIFDRRAPDIYFIGNFPHRNARWLRSSANRRPAVRGAIAAATPLELHERVERQGD